MSKLTKNVLFLDNLLSFENGYAVVQSDQKYGVIDPSGNIIIPLEYDGLSSYIDGLFVAKKDEKFGYIDISNHWVIKPEYDEAYHFSEKLALVKKDGKYGFIDQNNKVQIPLQYEQANFFSEGLAPVANSEGKLGFINPQSELIIPYKYDCADMFEYGLSYIEIQTDDQTSCGYINTKGEEVIPCIYLDALQLSEEYIYVYIRDDNRSMVLDRKGNQVAWTTSYEDVDQFIEGKASVSDGKKYGMVDTKGNLIIPCMYDAPLVRRGGDLLITTRLGRKWGAISQNQDVVIPFKYVKPIRNLGENRYVIENSPTEKIIVDQYNYEVFRFEKEKKKTALWKLISIAIVLIILISYFLSR